MIVLAPPYGPEIHLALWNKCGNLAVLKVRKTRPGTPGTPSTPHGYTPAPPALTLVGLGLAAMYWIKNRRVG